ncbi:MAG: hypothetical protein OXF11_09565 [Deltaproteobacteria bacterium]|nr:hypothetical protein [Deltaproteobacteria bacterium]
MLLPARKNAMDPCPEELTEKVWPLYVQLSPGFTTSPAVQAPPPTTLLLTVTRTALEQLFVVSDSPDTVSTQAP